MQTNIEYWFLRIIFLEEKSADFVYLKLQYLMLTLSASKVYHHWSKEVVKKIIFVIMFTQGINFNGRKSGTDPVYGPQYLDWWLQNGFKAKTIWMF